MRRRMSVRRLGVLHGLVGVGLALAGIALPARAAEPELVPLARARANAARPAAPPAPNVSGTDERIARITDLARVRALRSAAREERRVAERALSAAGRADLRALERRPGGAARVVLRPGANTPRLLAGPVLEPAAGGGAGGAADVATARRLLRARRALLRLSDPDRELALVRSERDELGHRHLRFEQRLNGIPVWPAELTVHVDAAGDAYLLNGASVATPSGVPATPALDAGAAAAAARAAVGAGSGATTTEPELIVYAPGDRPPRLAWRLAVDAHLRASWWVVVDAASGERLHVASRVMDADVAGSGLDLFGISRALHVWNEAGLHYLVDTSKAMYDPTSDPPEPSTTRGGITVLDARNQPPTSNPTTIPPLFHVTSTNPNVWTVPDGVSASFGLAQTYDYYLERHARNSIDGAGGSVLAAVRLGQGYQNAFWHGGLQAMFFGDGEPYAGALDVVGHELTHGVIDSTARLIYQDQSGAANEAFADIFGESVETRTLGAPDWVLGAALGDPIRNMANPDALEIGCGRNYPARMSQFLLPSDPLCGAVVEFDAGGVHLNSGIVNRAYYLLAAGLGASALGTTDAARVFYRALAFHLVANSRFVDVRLAAVASAEELFGAGSSQALRTAEAFDLVEIFDGAGTPTTPSVPPIAGPDATMFLRYEPALSTYFLWRKEEALLDPAAGQPLSYFDVALRRPSITHDGSLAWFVDSIDDVCLIDTAADPYTNPAEQEFCMGFAGFIRSVAVSGDGLALAVVLRDPFTGDTENAITVIDLTTGLPTDYPLAAPVRDGAPVSTLLFADVLNWNASGTMLIFDALNELSLPGGATTLTWSIYALDLLTGEVLDVVPPLAGASFDYPALSQLGDGFLVFDAVDAATGNSTIYAGDLNTGDLQQIATVAGFEGVPSYSGDDLAIVYSQPAATPSGTSLHRRPVGPDHITPSGPPALLLANADFGAIYRRGAFSGPSTDSDLDGIPNDTDNCPHEANSDQVDDGGFDSATSNGVGNACECGDLGTDGETRAADVTALRNYLARAALPVPALQRCSVVGSIECDLVDAVVLRRALAAHAPAPAQVCAAASPL